MPPLLFFQCAPKAARECAFAPVPILEVSVSLARSDSDSCSGNDLVKAYRHWNLAIIWHDFVAGLQRNED